MPWSAVGKAVLHEMLESIETESQNREVLLAIARIECYSMEWINEQIKNLAIARNIKIDGDIITILPAGRKRLQKYREQQAKNEEWKKNHSST